MTRPRTRYLLLLFVLLFAGSAILIGMSFSCAARRDFRHSIAQLPDASNVVLTARTSISNTVAYLCADISSKPQLEALSRAIPTEHLSIHHLKTLARRMGGVCGCGTTLNMTVTSQGKTEFLHLDLHGVIARYKTRLSGEGLSSWEVFNACTNAGIAFERDKTMEQPQPRPGPDR